MAHSVELLLDPTADLAIRSAWRTLAAAGLPSQARITAASNRPHVTLIAARHIDAGGDASLRDLASLLPLEVTIGAALVFSGPRHTLARLIVATADLLEFHTAVDRLCRPWIAGEPFAHCRPGQWTPHVTLGRRIEAGDIGAALALLTERHPAGMTCQITGLRRWDGDRRVEHLLVG